MVLPLRCMCLALGLVGLLAGCATPVAYAPQGPALVTLPIAAAQVRDERCAFARYFQAELERIGHEAAAPPALWGLLHRPTTQPAPAAATLPARGLPRSRVSVLIVPGIFGDCVDEQAVPFGDGLARARGQSHTAAYAPYADLGLAGVRALQIPGQASSAHNGALIAESVLAEAARPEVETIVIVAYSKGLPDALHALTGLRQAGRLPAKLRALVSVAGVVMGTPVADAHASLYQAASGMLGLAGCSASQGGEVASLTREVRGAWLAEMTPLPDLAYYSVVAHAPRSSIGPGLTMFYDELSRIDPRNDGQVIGSDAILPRSALLAEVVSDHWDFVLPLSAHPSRLVRGMASGRDFPRQALFRAMVKYVVDDIGR